MIKHDSVNEFFNFFANVDEPLIMKHNKTLKLDYSTRLKINMIKHDNSIKN
jgi:hypothetical protein